VGKIDGLFAIDNSQNYRVLEHAPLTSASGLAKAERSAERHYDTVSLDEIKTLAMEQLAAPGCALFLWGF
jgi:N6-adenosine-specific RNA methylase IME4